MIPGLVAFAVLAILALHPGWAAALVLATVALGRWIDYRRERRARWGGWLK